MSLRARAQDGAAAVETGLLCSVLLVPLMMGVLAYGSYFWQAQRVEPMAARLAVGEVSGMLSCHELVDRVRTTVVEQLGSQGLGVPVPASAVLVDVVQVLPTVGAVVQVSVQVPGTSALGSLVPLPHGGALVSEAAYRLQDVAVTTSSC